MPDEMASAINKYLAVTKTYVQKLKKADILKRTCPAKGDHWEIVDRQKE